MAKGIVKFLASAIAGLINTPGKESGEKKMEMIQHKNMLLINGYTGPMPTRVKNQRQKRKAIRRVPQLQRKK